MAKLRISGKKKKSIVKIRSAMEKLQKSLLSEKKPALACDDLEHAGDSTGVPKDVKKGHFAVIAVDDEHVKRFVVPLTYLTHPSFLRLLEQAAEEYGFDHDGALAVPCRPVELERLLAEQWGRIEERGRGGGGGGSKVDDVHDWGFSKALVKRF
ncbi:hypothetical protein U1Q18_021041 [Sarracenia purpurea var. burkii]